MYSSYIKSLGLGTFKDMPTRGTRAQPNNSCKAPWTRLPAEVQDIFANSMVNNWKNSKAEVRVLFGESVYDKYRKHFPNSVPIQLSGKYHNRRLFGKKHKHLFLEREAGKVQRMVFILYHPEWFLKGGSALATGELMNELTRIFLSVDFPGCAMIDVSLHTFTIKSGLGAGIVNVATDYAARWFKRLRDPEDPGKLTASYDDDIVVMMNYSTFCVKYPVRGPIMDTSNVCMR